MSGLTIRAAKRSSAKPLIGLYSRSGCGKTTSALYLARGFVGPKGKIVMIETESGRGEANADLLPGGYDVIPLSEPFSPQRYGEAIGVAEEAGASALIIDSASHEWEGIGGVLDMAATNEANGKKGQLVWQAPKIDHAKYFMGKLLQTPISLVIVCMRAKYPMEQVTKNGKKEWQRSEHLDPKQSEDILFELFVHGWIDEQHAFHGTKYTRPDLARVIESGKPISIATGEALAAWARGDEPKQTAPMFSGPSESLDVVLEVLAKAKTIDEVNAAPDQLATIIAQLSEEEKGYARKAFAKRRKEMTSEKEKK